MPAEFFLNIQPQRGVAVKHSIRIVYIGPTMHYPHWLYASAAGVVDGGYIGNLVWAKWSDIAEL